VTLRFADALAELERAHGYRVDRSWWVAADAIESLRWNRGSEIARLAGGIEAPVSRTYRLLLMEAGWL
jgi:DNA-binding LytR/AlgR family response regulator